MAQSLKLLLAEDEPVHRLTLTKILGALGHEVTAVHDGRQAVDILNKSSPELFDAVITDYHMPYKSGGDVVEYCRQSTAWAGIPIVICSATVSRDQIAETMHRSSVSFLSKPIDVPTLLTALKRFF